eukprot:UN04375
MPKSWISCRVVIGFSCVHAGGNFVGAAIFVFLKQLSVRILFWEGENDTIQDEGRIYRRATKSFAKFLFFIVFITTFVWRSYVWMLEVNPDTCLKGQLNGHFVGKFMVLI